MPLNAIESGELEALLVTVAIPVMLPAEAGSNCTPNEVDCPAATVTGRATLVAVKPDPVTVILEIDTLELPVLLSVTVCLELVLVFKLPKLRRARQKAAAQKRRWYRIAE